MDDLARAVEGALERAVHRDSWSRKGKLYVSDLKHALPHPEGDCKRKLKGKLMDEPTEPMTPGVSLMLHAGDRLHEAVAEWLQDELGDEGWTVTGIEKRVKVEGLSGRLDIELQHDDGRTAVIDIKTKRGNAFRYLKESRRSDEIQVQAYMLGRDADIGLLLYVDREGQNWVVTFPVERDDESVKAAAAVLRSIRAADPDELELLEPQVVRNENKGPDSIQVKWPWQVEWCPLRDCHCEARASGTLPSGVIAHVKGGEVVMKPKYENRDDLKAWIEARIE